MTQRNYHYSGDGKGRATRYYVSFHDGVKKHKDGSDFYDMHIVRNKKDLNKFIKSLKEKGYIERPFCWE